VGEKLWIGLLWIISDAPYTTERREAVPKAQEKQQKRLISTNILKNFVFQQENGA
jgi:hypothetical protein